MIFEINNNNDIMLRVPLDFISEQQITQDNKHFCIRLPFEQLIGKILTHKITPSYLTFNIITHNNICDIKLVNILYNPEKYDDCIFKPYTYINKFKYLDGINLHSSVKGILVKHDSPIRKITIGQHGFNFIDHDVTLLSIYAQEIDNKHIYIPFNPLIPYEIPNFTGSIFIHDNLNIEIDSDNHNDIIIYTLCNNLVMYSGGHMLDRYCKSVNIKLKEIVNEELIINMKLQSDTLCSIIGDKIEENSYYWKCDKCTCVCEYDIFSIYITYKKKCPCCQLVLNVINKYKNIDEKIEN